MDKGPSRRHSKSGNAAVELALVAPFLMVLLLGVFDFGLAIHDRMQLASAVRAGVQYALHHSADPEIVQQTVMGALTIDPSKVTVTVDQICKCPGDTYMPCDGTCFPERIRTYVEIRTTSNYTPLFNYPMVPDNVELKAEAHVRVH